MKRERIEEPRKKAAAIVSAVMVAALLLTATYAWVDYDQHKTSELRSDNMNYQVTLNETFKEIKGWNANTPEINQDITVSNTGYKDDTYGNVFVRLQLREFFQVTPVQYTQTADRYMVAMPKENDAGKSDFIEEINSIMAANGAAPDQLAQFGANGYDNFVCFASGEGAQKFLEALAQSRWKDTLGPIVDKVDGPIEALHDVQRDQNGKPVLSAEEETIPIPRYYIKTNAKDPSGQYGKYIPTGIEHNDTTQVLTVRGGIAPPYAAQSAEDAHDAGAMNCLEWSGMNQDENGVDKPCPTGRDLHDNGECEYLVHLWNAAAPHGCDLFPHQHLRWNLGSDVITLDEWVNNHGSRPVAKWILDTTSPNGWAYWGQALKPEETTTKLMDSVTLLQQPDGEAYYAMHVDMEAIDLLRANQWTGDDVPTESKAPQALMDGIMAWDNSRVAIEPLVVAVPRTQTQSFIAQVDSLFDTDDITWSMTGNTSNATTLVDGVLTVAAEEPEDTAIKITATHNSSGKSATATATVAMARNTGVTFTNAPSNTLALNLGNQQQLQAQVTGQNIVQGVTWSLEENGTITQDENGTVSVPTKLQAGTTIDAKTGQLKVATNETVNEFVVKATSIYNPKTVGRLTVTINNPKPSNVKVVIPATLNSSLGGTYAFTPQVTGFNVTQGVTWTVNDGRITHYFNGTTTVTTYNNAAALKANTKMTGNTLSVAADETVNNFKATAAANCDTTAKAVCTVNVNNPMATGVSLSIPQGNQTLARSGTYQYTATVTGFNASSNVTWKIANGRVTNSTYGAFDKVASSSVSGGKVTVNTNEYVNTFAVQISLPNNSSTTQVGSRTVTVSNPKPDRVGLAITHQNGYAHNAKIAMGNSLNGNYRYNLAITGDNVSNATVTWEATRLSGTGTVTLGTNTKTYANVAIARSAVTGTTRSQVKATASINGYSFANYIYNYYQQTA